MAQPIYVKRESHESRTQTIQDILDRAKSTDTWPQIFIFPEGTCTNGKVMIDFKPGAFYPGVPVQPVLIRYPNKIDTVRLPIKSGFDLNNSHLFLFFFSVHLDLAGT
jgi:lysophosphatidylcholine acyltransferase/lyso-PAF acetyltransferase